MTSKHNNIVFIVVFVAWVHLTQVKSNSTSIDLRTYCDNKVFEKHKRPKFKWHPRPYILHYYKRCIDHDEWVDCITKTRKAPPEGVRVKHFEKSNPPKSELMAAGIVLCHLRLHQVQPNMTNCEFNNSLCNDPWEDYDDWCWSASKKANCIWSQHYKCGIWDMLPLYEYEFGLLGGKCLQQLKRKVYPFSRSDSDCSDDSWSPMVGLVSGPGLLWYALVCSLALLLR